MKYVRNIANKNFASINREKPIPPCLQGSQWRAMLRAVSSEKANYARDNGISLVNTQENPTSDKQDILATVCEWENNVKGANFFALHKMLYHLVAHCFEASAQKMSQLEVKILHESNIDIPCFLCRQT